MPLPVAASVIACVTARVLQTTAGDDVLLSVRIPPGVLKNNGDMLRITAACTTAANADSKTTKILWGASATTASGQTNTSSGANRVERAHVVRRGPQSQFVLGESVENGAGIITRYNDFTEDENLPLQVRLTGGAASASDIESRFLMVEYIPASSLFGQQ